MPREARLDYPQFDLFVRNLGRLNAPAAAVAEMKRALAEIDQLRAEVAEANACLQPRSPIF